MSAIYTKKKFAWIDNHVGSRSAKAALAEVKKPAGVGLFSCSLCAFTCFQRKDLKYHYAIKHFQEEILAGIEKNTICGLCGFKSHNKCQMTMHYATKHEYLKSILVRMNIEIDKCETSKGTGLCVQKDKPTTNIRKPSNDSSKKLFTDPVKRIYSQDGSSGLTRCDLCDYTSKQNCQLRYHYCTVHFREDILKEIEDLQLCVLCGRFETKSAQSMVVHYGTKHGFLDTILSQRKKLGKDKKMNVDIPGSAEHHKAREPREVPAFQGSYLQEVTAVYGEDEGRPLQEDQVKLEREHQGSKLETYIFIIHTLLCEWTIFILVFSTHVNKLCDITPFCRGITHFHL